MPASPPFPPVPPIENDALKLPPDDALFTEPPAPPPPPIDCRNTACALSPCVCTARGAIWLEDPRVTEPAEPPPPPAPPVDPEPPNEKEEFETDVDTLLPMIDPPVPPPPPIDCNSRPWDAVPDSSETFPVDMLSVSGTKNSTFRPEPPSPPLPPIPNVAEPATFTFPEADAALVTDPPAPPPPPTDCAKKPMEPSPIVLIPPEIDP